MKIPAHLRQYVVEQNYSAYTPIHQAVWRFIMRQNRNFLEGRAHSAYVDGLRGSGISVDAIPRVEEMNRCLAPHGWGAVTISGFIPGVAFFDFQKHGLLPIATDMRQPEHIDYTPAPDIVHEAAGHAPILCDPEYARYVRAFGEIGSKAIASREELTVFDAVKHLSDIMELGTATEDEIAAAKARLEEALRNNSEPSEAELLGRLYWWTVEYGLIGTLERPQIYGAGLLSSIGESQNCLTDKVRKLPFDLETVLATAYDITTQQPQLFVCESFAQLTDAVTLFSERMAYKRGGLEALNKALRSGSVTTAVWQSGLQVTGVIEEIVQVRGEPAYIRFTGPCALACNERELPGQGRARHPEGFGSPVGRLSAASAPLEQWTDEELHAHGLQAGRMASLAFASGVEVNGRFFRAIREDSRLVLIQWRDCRVTLGDRLLFDPAWGEYDMAVGATIPSVFAGSADPEAYFAESASALNPSRPDATWTPLDHLYQRIRDLREAGTTGAAATHEIEAVYAALEETYPNDWLLRMELLELLTTLSQLPDLRQRLSHQIEQLKAKHDNLQNLIDNALQLV